MSESQLPRRTYDLFERTAVFGESAISFCSKLPQDTITRPLIVQLIKCATSVGANYCEADDAESKQDFRHKIGIVKKECRESMHFIRMIMAAFPESKEKALVLKQEATELNLIFDKIYKKVS